MAVDKLVVRLDAAHISHAVESSAVRHQHSIAASEAQLIREGVWIEPYSKCAMLTPLQFGSDAYLDTDIDRYGISAWTSSDDPASGTPPAGGWLDHWDEISREEELHLVSDGETGANEIFTLEQFKTNTGFVLEFFLYGPENDIFEALTLTFGGWSLKIMSNGEALLYKGAETSPRASGWIISRRGHTLVGHKSLLVIMPTADGTLYVRRNGIAGFTYKLPDDEIDTADPVIIEAGAFGLTAPSSKVQFSLTKLQYDTSADGYVIWPNRQFPKPPPAGQTFSVEPDWLNLGGAVSFNIYDPLGDGEDYDDLAPFVGDGTKDEYCIAATFTPNASGTVSPFVRGALVTADELEPTVPEDPEDISEDVISCEIECSESLRNTSATIRIRTPEDHPILGACNRRAKLTIGDAVIFDGVMEEPPRLVYGGREEPYYEVKLTSLVKLLDLPCLDSSCAFDGQEHVDVVRWLFAYTGIPVAMLECDTDSQPLRDSTEGQDKAKSSLRPQVADTALEWIEKVAEETGWLVMDGPLSDGVTFGFRYVDPLGLSETSTHTFYVSHADSAGDEAYDLIRDSLTCYSADPEANEVHVVGCNEAGELIDVTYVDELSQNGALGEESRPENWLGVRKLVTIPVRGKVPEWLLKRMALRIGKELCLRTDMVEFEADWKPGLWRGSVVTIDVGDTGIEGAGVYRIESMRLSFADEWADEPSRRAEYKAVKIADANLGSRFRYVGDEALLKAIGYYLLNGATSRDIAARPTSADPTHSDPSGVLGCGGPIKRVVRLVDDNGVQFVPGANALDETTWVS